MSNTTFTIDNTNFTFLNNNLPHFSHNDDEAIRMRIVIIPFNSAYIVTTPNAAGG